MKLLVLTIDANRTKAGDAAYTDPDAEFFYDEYHNTIQSYLTEIRQSWPETAACWRPPLLNTIYDLMRLLPERMFLRKISGPCPIHWGLCWGSLLPITGI